ncbi:MULTISPECIES: aminopeptidase N [unclassified Vibrio]|uniref:Aminopeptidase N n=1 Tax=Vibrio sp. HB236076 TaxID=3232307 RepID=A0AB39HBB6_9VIBR|nr:aminopeptidase N [Vibrio sp. HB161653]MDP5253390.1 aminopeptidase N [Vibrio sp. HB161653]
MEKNTPKALYRKDYKESDYFIKDVDLLFDIYDDHTVVVATLRVEANKKVNNARVPLVLDGEGLELISVSVDDRELEDFEFQVNETSLTIYPETDSFELETVVHIDPKANTSLDGMYYAEGVFLTQCEAQGFHKITYFLDRPDILSTYSCTIMADEEKCPVLLSNGTPFSASNVDEGRHKVSYRDPVKKPCYLFALVAGDLECLEDSFTTMSGREVTLKIFGTEQNIERSDYAMSRLKAAMKWDEERFGLEYDLDTYFLLIVDFFNMGAMENKGLNIFNSKYVLANEKTATDKDYHGIEAVIGHEYFHNWTGNRVTCRDWFQLSLKEGLTVFRDQEFSSDLGSRVVNRINNVRIIRGPQFAEDASPMSHPIRPEKVIEMNNFYTLTVYEKGSEVIRMLHTLLGETRFQQGVKTYLQRHDGTAATCDDFICAMEEASGIDLTQFRRWYSQSGTPVLTVKSTYFAERKQLQLDVWQYTPATQDQSEKSPLHIPLDIELYAPDGSVLPLFIQGQGVDNVLNITESHQTFVFDNLDVKPVVSLLREFSAPVKLEYDYTDQELIFLTRFARNAFSRWDASQMLVAKYLKNMIDGRYEGISPLPDQAINAFRDTLVDKDLDPAFVAQVLTLPSENDVAGWYQRIDVEGVCRAVNAVKKQLATALHHELFETYQRLEQSDYQITAQAMGKRALRNQCLTLLALTKKGEALPQTHYQRASNMTDSMAALQAANQAQLACRDWMMDEFSRQWQGDGLVMDKWFHLQGTNPSENVLSDIQSAMTHPDFSMKNPNRIRNLIGAFVMQNFAHFHHHSGSGYRFAGETITQLNQVNPQLASSLIDPLLKFKRYDEHRQAMMKAELEQLAEQDLAKDLYEKVSSALAQ